jgi:hypothetical protein
LPPAAHQTPRADAAPPASQGSGLSRREVLVGAGGTSAPLDDFGVDTGDGLRQAKVFTRANRPVPGTAAGTWTRAAAGAVEDATWSAMRDPSTGYGVAVFDLDPGEPGGETSITVTYHHAAGADAV